MAARTLREQSWDSVHSSDASHDIIESTEDDAEITQRQPRIRTIQDVHNVIHPLRATADRVGKEVERFAETLDKFTSTSNLKDCRKVLPIVRKYEQIASDTVARLQRFHEPERQERLKGKWSRKVEQARTPTPSIRSRSNGPDNGTTVEDLEHWEQERQTWQLLALMLQCQYPVVGEDQESHDQESELPRPRTKEKIHQYSSEADLWNNFLCEYDDVWDKHVVIEWLKSNAESNGPPIDVVIEELDQAADRGQGLSAHSWLYSKEAIKAHKRLQTIQGAIELDAPNSRVTSKEKKKRLVTQLDPDAVSRQGLEIETEDAFFQRAAWLGCWEMMRRGESWQAIRSFCQERVEGWRALSVRGDPRLPDSNKSGMSIQSGPRSRVLWRKMCEKLAKEGGINEYETAVYGLLSGYQEAMDDIGRSWDDHLFALYNSQILQQFDYYIEKSYPKLLPTAIDASSVKIFDPVKPNIISGRQTWELLLSHDKTKIEARSAIKMLQGSLIARLFEKYIHQQGLALGRSVSGAEQKKKQMLRSTNEQPFELGASADVTVEDYDILRIMTHIILVFMDLGALKSTSVATENIIFAYVSFLANAGKYDLLPVYASRLSEKTSIELMARQMHIISNPADQRLMTRLMEQHRLNTTEILRRHLQFLAEQAGADSGSHDFKKLNLVGTVRKGSFDMPGINKGVFAKDITPEEYDLIHAVEWYLSLDGAWEDTMLAGTLVYKHFLRNGSFAAAATLSEELPFAKISATKSRAILGVQANLADEWRSRGDAEQDLKAEVMLRQADTLIGLEYMMQAVIAFSEWQHIFEVFIKNENEERRKLQRAHNNIEATIEHLLDSWLQQPATEAEKADLDAVRTTYLPDLVLAYISSIYFDGHKLTREMLLKTMDLAIDIAANGSEVGACFQAAGRMSDLMDFMAISSMAVMRADELRNLRKGAKKTRVGRKGGNFDVWNVVLPERKDE